MKTRSRVLLSLVVLVSMVLSTLLYGVPPVRSDGDVIYVDVDATGSTHNGTSWATALTSLQDALTGSYAATAGDQIWIAEGVYRPGLVDAVTATFNIPSGVALYGGFAGSEATLDERTPSIHLTILSGDLNHDDTVDAHGVTLMPGNIVAPNAYHVVTLNGVTSATLLDGLIITGGAGQTSAPGTYGGGLYATNSDFTVVDVTFIGNLAYGGGATYLSGGSPVLAHVLFLNNEASTRGGAVLLQTSATPTTPTIRDATFVANEATDGGALACQSSSPTLTDVALYANSATDRGGALYMNAGSPVLTNFTVAGNTAPNGTALYLGNSATPSVTNTIIWGNLPAASAPVFVLNTMPTITYSLVQGGAVGTGNLDADPHFVNAATGDLRLMAGSPAIDTGSNVAVPAGVTTDLAGESRFVDGNNDGIATVDMGAYEYAPFVSTSLSIGDQDGVTGATVQVPVHLTLSQDELYGADLLFSYDPTRLELTGLGTGALTASWALEFNNIQASGQIDVSMASATPVTGDGEFLVLTFTALGTDETTSIGWVSAELNEGGIVPDLHPGSVTLHAPAAVDFVADTTSGLAPLTVAFTSQATGDVDSYVWHFGDDSTATEANPIHTYSVRGLYDVSLTVTGPGGNSAQKIETDYITVYERAVAAFSASPRDGIAPLEVVFTNESTGDFAASAWDFGDGGTSNQENPTHTYTEADNYTVTLTVSGCGSESTETKTAFVGVRLGSIAGTVTYWQDARPVAGAAISLSGTASRSVQTGANGSYALADLYRGEYTVTPGDGAPVGTTAVSPLDASYVLRHAAGLSILSGSAFTAADVTLNGTATAYDASYILRKAAGSIPLASPIAGMAWRFDPVSLSYSSDSFNHDLAGQNYTGVLYGDVTGNWDNGAESTGAAQRPIVELSIEPGPVSPTGLVTATLRLVSTEMPFYSLALDVVHDGTAALEGVSLGERAAGWMVAHHSSGPGVLRLVMAGPRPVEGLGTLALLTFRLPAGQTELEITPVATVIDEGAVSVHWSSLDADHRLYFPLIRR